MIETTSPSSLATAPFTPAAVAGELSGLATSMTVHPTNLSPEQGMAATQVGHDNINPNGRSISSSKTTPLLSSSTGTDLQQHNVESKRTETAGLHSGIAAEESVKEATALASQDGERGLGQGQGHPSPSAATTTSTTSSSHTVSTRDPSSSPDAAGSGSSPEIHHLTSVVLDHESFSGPSSRRGSLHGYEHEHMISSSSTHHRSSSPLPHHTMYDGSEAPHDSPRSQSPLHRATSPRLNAVRADAMARSTSSPALHRRPRAGSFTTPASAPLGLGPVDLGSAWLSEDEATNSMAKERLHRRSSTDRRRRARQVREGDVRVRPGVGTGDAAEERVEGVRAPALAATFSTTTAELPILHRPAALSSATPSRPTSPPAAITQSALAVMVPAILASLTCLACHRLLIDPTTLGCGHTLCYTCTPGVHHRRPSTQRLASDALYEGIATSESQFARNPSPVGRSSVLPLVGSLLGSVLPFGPTPVIPTPATTSTADRSIPSSSSTPTPVILGPGGLRNPLVCPVADCVHKDRTTTISGGELKVDYVLQKVLDLLKRDLPEFQSRRDLLIQREDIQHPSGTSSVMLRSHDLVEDEGEEEDEGRVRRPRFRSARSSGSSGGGGEDPENEDENKRVHRSKTWMASKKLRRFSNLAAGGEGSAGEEEEEEEGYDVEGIPSTFIAELQSELECQVCVQLYYEPITTPCGHTFCQKCLARSLDHSDKCPLCRADFPSFTFFQSQPINSTTQSLILAGFPLVAAERKASIEAEERSNSLDTPIFVCTLAWPNLPTYIHIFEPRYRLMMRRVMDGDQQFGMVLPSRTDGGLSEYGTMLRVKSCNMIEDGRSIVETMGTYRFRLLEKGTFDGYTVGRIERVDDISEEQEAELERIALARNVPGVVRERTPPVISLPTANSPPPRSPSGAPPAQSAVELSTNELMSICLEFVETLRSGSAPWVIQRLNNTIGPMPTNPSDFSYWMAEVMPVDDHVKAALLQITSSRERLRLLVFWIDQFRSAWWFRSGCSVM